MAVWYCPGWKTRAQLLQIHGCETTVQGIVEKKLQLGHWKEHPDLPDCAEATLFYVLLDLDRTEEDEHEDRVEVNWAGEMDGNNEARCVGT